MSTSSLVFRALIFCDLDETLIAHGEPLSAANAAAAAELARRGIGVVAASGRSLPMLRKVAAPEFPLCCAIVSTGVGIVAWPEGELLRRCELTAAQAAEAVCFLAESGADFLAFSRLPESRIIGCHTVSAPGGIREDYHRRLLRHYSAETREIPSGWDGGDGLGQLLAVYGAEEETEAAAVAAELRRRGFAVARATSPIDGRSIWIEVFAAGVGKAAAAAWVAERFAPGAPRYALGNDYNDLDMLDWADFAALSPFALSELRDGRYPVLDVPPEEILGAAARHWGLL